MLRDETDVLHHVDDLQSLNPGINCGCDKVSSYSFSALLRCPTFSDAPTVSQQSKQGVSYIALEIYETASSCRALHLMIAADLDYAQDRSEVASEA